MKKKKMIYNVIMRSKNKNANKTPITDNKFIAFVEHWLQVFTPCLEKPQIQQLQRGPVYPYSQEFSVAPPLFLNKIFILFKKCFI